MRLSTLPSPRLKVLIIGAGPAGLCAAAALTQEGHNVTVVERQRSLQSRGNALVIQPAAVKALAYLNGAHEALNKVSVTSDRLCYWSYKDEKPFATSGILGKRFETDRPSVQRAMYQLATASGTEVRFGVNTEHIEDRGEKPTVHTSEGEVLEADVVIGADGRKFLQTLSENLTRTYSDINTGIKSVVRKCLFPEQNTDPIPIRESIFLSSIPVSQIQGNAEITKWLEPGTTHGTLGPGRFILSRPLHGGMFGVQFIDVDHAEPSAVDSNWNTPADITKLRDLFADFNPTTRAFLEHIDHAEKWQIAVGPELDTWRSKNGRVVLLGDAAHAMIPHAAQGLSQGIEDGISLARMLRRTDSCGIPAITDAWVQLRKPRADLFVQRSMNNAKLRSLPDGPAQARRDEQLKKSGQQASAEISDVKMDMAADQNSPQFMKWVREYDVFAEVRIC